jgi:hypothetical protein
MTDNRREPRYRVSARAQLRLPNGQQLAARVCDISVNGIGFTVNDPLPLQQTLAALLSIPDPAQEGQLCNVPCSIIAMNMVLSGNDFRVGAVWAHLQGDALRTIDRWLEKQRQAGPTHRINEGANLQWTAGGGS